MTLAAIDNYVWLIAAAAYGVVAWLNDRKQKKALAEEEARRRAEGGTSAPPLRPTSAGESSEEERMRKFLEALGVPSTPQSPPLRPTTEPAPLKPAPPAAPKPAPQKPASPTLAPRPVAMPVPRPVVTRPAQVPARMAPPPRPKPPIPLPELEPVPVESLEPGRLEGAASSVEQVATDFARMHEARMAVDTLPSIQVAATGSAGTTSVVPRFVSAQGLVLREMLRTPESLRAAIVVSEVLGPPKGL